MSRSVDLHDLEIAENLYKCMPNDDGLSYEEALLQQASMYHSFQERARDNNKGTCDDDDDDNDDDDDDDDDDDISDWGHLLVDEGGSSRNDDVKQQEAIDEALARSLQELGEGFDDLLVSELSGSSSGSAESHVATSTRAQAASSNSRQDPIDLDSMRYEDLLQLAESVGVENRGISEARISKLPSSKYGSRLFAKKKKENCVICLMDFEYGDRMITLPCSHQYHSKCVSEWLKGRKNCPICQKEVV